MRKSVVLWGVLSAVALAGCQTGGDFHGKGPIVLSDFTVKKYREDYLKKPGSTMFYVSEDGRYSGYWYCSTGPGACRSARSMELSLNACAKAAGMPCHVFDRGGWVVWEGPITWGGSAAVSRSRVKYEVPDGARGRSILDMKDVELCEGALGEYSDKPVWTTVQKNLGYMYTAISRGLNPESCHRLLNP